METNSNPIKQILIKLLLKSDVKRGYSGLKGEGACRCGSNPRGERLLTDPEGWQPFRKVWTNEILEGREWEHAMENIRKVKNTGTFAVTEGQRKLFHKKRIVGNETGPNVSAPSIQGKMGPDHIKRWETSANHWTENIHEIDYTGWPWRPGSGCTKGKSWKKGHLGKPLSCSVWASGETEGGGQPREG